MTIAESRPHRPAQGGMVLARLAVLGLLLVAAALRWVEPGLVEFKYDEAHITGLALAVASGDSMPLLSGGTTLGIPRSALDVYLLALPLRVIAGRPEAAVWFVGALGVLAVAVTYVLGLRIGGPAVGVLAAGFMAANPWLVVYDRKLWAHIQVLLSVLLLLVAWEVVVAARQRRAAWFPILAALQLLAHVLALVQALSWIGAVLITPRRWANRWLLIGFAVACVMLAPYVWALMGGGELSQPASTGDAQSMTARWLAARQVLGGAGLSSVIGLPAAATWWGQAAEVLSWVVMLLILIGLARTIYWLTVPDRKATARLLLAWTAGPLLALVLGPIRVFSHYWTALLPLPALFLAIGCAGLGAATRRRGLAVGAAGVATLALIVTWTASYAGVVAALSRGGGSEAFGAPLARWQMAVGAAEEWAGRLSVDQVKVAVAGVDPGQESEPAAVAALIGNPPYARFLAPSSPAALLLSEGAESLYLTTLDDIELEARLSALGEAVWAGDMGQGAPAARLYRLPAPQNAALSLTPLDRPAIFDVGLELVGFAFSPAGENAVEATLVWRVNEPPPEVRELDFTAFNHIIDSAGRTVAQVDGMALLSRDWWPGDVLVQPYRLELPAGQADKSLVWRAGLYSRVDGRRSQLQGGGDAVDIPLAPFAGQSGFPK